MMHDAWCMCESQKQLFLFISIKFRSIKHLRPFFILISVKGVYFDSDNLHFLYHDRKRNGTCKSWQRNDEIMTENEAVRVNIHTLKALFQPFGLFSPNMTCIPPRICIACCPLQHFWIPVLVWSLNTCMMIAVMFSDSLINERKMAENSLSLYIHFLPSWLALPSSHHCLNMSRTWKLINQQKIKICFKNTECKTE